MPDPQVRESRSHQLSIVPALAMMVMAAMGGAALIGHRAGTVQPGATVPEPPAEVLALAGR
ncbi:hypothetical protein [Zavarzinia sp. CC-PAN008]|uniref:hypothetical protein n=1 Tax=Zavarzinia sp. CC-PAN008 TaxID=3243332 RepID=UPI003F7437D8